MAHPPVSVVRLHRVSEVHLPLASEARLPLASEVRLPLASEVRLRRVSVVHPCRLLEVHPCHLSEVRPCHPSEVHPCHLSEVRPCHLSEVHPCYLWDRTASVAPGSPTSKPPHSWQFPYSLDPLAPSLPRPSWQFSTHHPLSERPAWPSCQSGPPDSSASRCSPYSLSAFDDPPPDRHPSPRL